MAGETSDLSSSSANVSGNKASDSSLETSITQAAEVFELEELRKVLDKKIAEKRAKEGQTSRQGFVPLIDRAAAGNLSTAVFPPSTPSIISETTPAPGEKVVKEVRDETTMTKKTVCTGGQDTASSSGLSAGQFMNEWFNGQMMRAMRNIDGKDALHLHVEKRVLQLIAEDKYVDFGRLLKDEDEDDKDDPDLQVYNQDGVSFFIPTTKRPRKIQNYQRWAEAFTVFQSVSHEFFPQRAGELMEYKEFIERASGVFEWKKVYAYDRRFRCVQERTPQRPWNLVNQDAKDTHLLGKGESCTSKPGATAGSSGGTKFEQKPQGQRQRKEKERVVQKVQLEERVYLWGWLLF